MNLEKELWKKDPRKAWMKEYQCGLIREYLQDRAIPALERNRIFVNSLLLSGVHKTVGSKSMGFSMLPMSLLTGTDILFGWQFNFSVLKSDRFVLPRFMSGPTPMKSMVDIEMGAIGRGDVFFSVPINSESGTTWMFFTPAHLEEMLCILKGRAVNIHGIARIEPAMTVNAVEINKEGWERLGTMNPFHMIDV